LRQNYGTEREPNFNAKTMKTTYADIPPFVTKDGSLIRELIHPVSHGPGAMSFAEAVVDSGTTTALHLHPNSEEIYHVSNGVGRMKLGAEEFDVRAGDTIKIKPGTAHNLTNTGAVPLKILCVCHPAYSDEDTVLL
jgi:mannose-6-phosphate isomerase-like protein (cupin superfamily)